MFLRRPGGDVHDQGAPSGGDAPGAADEGGDATADWLMTIQRHLGKYKLIGVCVFPGIGTCARHRQGRTLPPLPHPHLPELPMACS
jgi:hypothetical protein